MAIYRGAGGPGDATTDAANEASVASNKATEAAASAAAAASSASAASNSATSASNSATAAASSASSASSSASSASSSASSASSSASDAADSATAADAAQTAAETAQTAAETAQSAAEAAQAAAETAETNAETAQAAAEAAQASAEDAETGAIAARDAALDALAEFDDRYFGAFVDDAAVATYAAAEGFTIDAGDLYFNTTNTVMKVWSGTAWLSVSVVGGGTLDDISDVTLTSTTTGDILKYNGTDWVNSDDYASSAQGSLADSAVQPGDNVSDLTNDAGYLTSFTETDPVFSASEAASITSTDTTNWDTAYGWGDHAAEGYLTTAVSSVDMTVPTGFTVSGNPITTTGTLAVSFDTGYSLPTTGSQDNWDTAYGWGDHASAGYLTDITGESIKDLSDVYTSMVPTDGQILTWDNTNSRWDAADAPVSLPDQTGNSGKFLTTDGTDASWEEITTVSTSESAESLVTATWTVTESAGVLYFAYDGTNKASLDSSGNLVVVGNVTAYGTI